MGISGVKVIEVVTITIAYILFYARHQLEVYLLKKWYVIWWYGTGEFTHSSCINFSLNLEYVDEYKI